jgi:hypothetical protein
MPTAETRSGRPATTLTLVPDDEDFWTLLERGEEPLLLQLAGAEDDEQDSDRPYRLPAPIADRVALGAYNRVQRVLAERRRQPRGRLLDTDGTYEHLPLLLVELSAEDLDVLDAAVQALNRALIAGQEPDLAELLADIAGAWGAWKTTKMTAEELVGDFGRVLAALTLSPDDDTRRLADRLAAAAPSADVVLTVAEEAAYQRVASRLNLVLAAASPIDRFKY